MGFSGFPADALVFLDELARNNDREWFVQNKGRYEASLLGPEREFVHAVGEVFASIDPRVKCEPAVDRSIFRINRDTRFSKDKSPYKTYADLWFWIGEDRKQSPGYFVRIVPGEIWAGGGRHFMTPAAVVALRKAIDDEVLGAEFAETVSGLEADGYTIGEKTLKGTPRGFSADHPRADLLRLTAVHAVEEVSPVPASFTTPQFVDWCVERFERTRPLMEWLLENV